MEKDAQNGQKGSATPFLKKVGDFLGIHSVKDFLAFVYYLSCTCGVLYAVWYWGGWAIIGAAVSCLLHCAWSMVATAAGAVIYHAWLLYHWLQTLMAYIG